MNKKIVSTIAKRCLGYRKGEKLLIVCDDKLSPLAHDFYRLAKGLKIESVLVQMAPRRMHGEEPPEAVAGAMKEADCAVLLTSMSLSHTQARKEACREHGTRIASLPGISEEILQRSVCLGYASLKKKVARIARLLTRAKRIEIITGKGTHLIMSVTGRKGYTDNGLYARKGAFGNLPAGEACIAPREGTTRGRLVVDGSAPIVGKIKHPAEIVIRGGYARNMPFPELTSTVKALGKCALNVAEFGIGLNPRAKVTGNVLEDEKTLGTAHIALGNNTSFGGNVSCPCHLDFVFFKPGIIIDGVRVRFY
jgi:leucyl aminopeptidase (aminopeptidase T)